MVQTDVEQMFTTLAHPDIRLDGEKFHPQYGRVISVRVLWGIDYEFIVRNMNQLGYRLVDKYVEPKYGNATLAFMAVRHSASDL